MGMSRARPPRQSLRKQVPKAVGTFFAAIIVIVLYLHTLGVTDKFHENMGTLERRKVINGVMCDVQRDQLRVFMASFFGGIFAADQWYARNLQLAIPKFLVLFMGLGGGLLEAFGTLVSISPMFAWWIIDVVMWGVGYYTTGTNGDHFGNPTEQCALKGW